MSKKILGAVQAIVVCLLLPSAEGSGAKKWRSNSNIQSTE